MRPQRVAALVSLMVFLAGCATGAPKAPAAGQPAPSSSGAPPPAERVVTLAINIEPTFIAGFAPLPPAGATDFWQRAFNAFLELYDDHGKPMPYLAESLPVLNTDSWEVFPDGRMETRYHLKPNLVWHDGAPLTADDFVFAYAVSAPSNGFRTATEPFNLMSELVATDDRSFVIRWKSIYPDAGVLMLGDVKLGLVPLPRHILEKSYNQGLEAFQQDPYWSHEFVGAGPFKLDKWELGSHLEGVAFDQHVLGRPKIDRIRMQFISDPNTAMANLLAGTTDVGLDTITFPQMLQLKREWESTHQGTAGNTVASFTALYIEHRPDYTSPRAIADVRVRRALAHAVDKKTLADTVWAGELAILDTIFDPRADYYPAIDRAITKYPYDPRTSERLMAEAGFAKGPDGVFASPSEGKLTFNLQYPQARSEPPVIAANLREAGFDVQEQPLPPAEEREPRVRATFPALYIQASGLTESQQIGRYTSSQVATADNGFRGDNNTGWRNAMFDQLAAAFSVTLDRDERIQQRAQMAKIMSDELPAIMLTDNPNPIAYLSRVKNISSTPAYLTTGRITWNIDRWEVQ